ncbi:hypothetical protein [Paraliobacillus sp. X-1268]|uniref:hypothetical protein n=1 Tax=Paraliobacillus sp. X-1268 TaxID=2213193 RepID=UPI000E3B5F56|nr:hypothetical protein [Paraliobacillus sp. X-1268]
MRYELLSTEFDEEVGKRIIKVHDIEEDFTYVYYEDEIENIEIVGLTDFMNERADQIAAGVYDVPMP